MVEILAQAILLAAIAGTDPGAWSDSLLSWWSTWEWGESDDYEQFRPDYEQVLWDYENYPLQANRINAAELSRLPEIGPVDAKKIVEERETGGIYQSVSGIQARTGLTPQAVAPFDGIGAFGNLHRIDARLHVRADRRFGPVSDDMEERYDGSPIGLTQRYTLSMGQFQGGILLDKDKFEPKTGDLTRYHAVYRNERGSVIFGDFNVAAGLGVTLWTRPVFFDSFDTKASYEQQGRGISPASETRQNSSLRGLAADFRWNSWKGCVFASKTPLDATLNDSGGINRLSNGGLHRSPGERFKQNTVSEKTIGSILQYSWTSGKTMSGSISLAGYAAEFDPPLNPDENNRDRFPLTGGRTSAVGLSGDVSIGETLFLGEVAWDEDGHTAWKIGLSGRESGRGKVNWNATHYQYSPSYHNPHASPPVGSSNAQNRTGGALMISFRPDMRIVKEVKSHVEIASRQWRSYSVPRPFVSSKGSLEITCKLTARSLLITRYRRKIGMEGSGEEDSPLENKENRLRVTLQHTQPWKFFNRSKVYFEGSTSRKGDKLVSYGSLVGGGIYGSLGDAGSVRGSIRYRIEASGFFSARSLPMYLGEAGLPDRISSVRLSGRGVRWSASLLSRSGRFQWLGLNVARTVHFKPSDYNDDTALYLTMSYRVTASAKNAQSAP